MALAITGLQPGDGRGIALGEARAEGVRRHRLQSSLALSRTSAGTAGMAEKPFISARR